MSKVRITDEMVDAINNICSDEPEEISIRYEDLDFNDWNKPKGKTIRGNPSIIRRLMRELKE
tara:strand:+ start:42 stop:227 length:186 start_codon:yes stop_codon:yes gene_type:complete